MSNRIFKGSLLATTMIAGLAIANPAFAQDAAQQPGTQTAPEDETSGPDPDAPPSDNAWTQDCNQRLRRGQSTPPESLLRYSG